MEYLSALISGQLSAFRAVFELYHAKLYGYIVQKTKSEYLAEEVVQLTFIKLWETRKQLSLNCDISFQLFRIARTVLIDQLRKENVRNHHLSQLQLIYGKDGGEIELEQIYRLIERMPEGRKQVFKLNKLEGYSYKEIAKLLGISPKTVENHISQALKYLRKAILSIVLFALLRHFINIS